MFDEDKRKHLEFLQNTITRMNTNSFQLKGLAITIIAALYAIFASNSKIEFLFICVPVPLLFHFLDSFYLMQERKIRGIYNDVAEIKHQNDVQLYEFPLEKYKGNKYSYIESFFSKPTFGLYFPLLLLNISILIIKAMNLI